MTRSVPAVLPGPGVGELREKHPAHVLRVGEQVVGGRRRGGVLHPEHRFLDDLLLRRPAPVDGGVATPERRAMARWWSWCSRPHRAGRGWRPGSTGPVSGPVAYPETGSPVSVRSRLMTINGRIRAPSNQIRSDLICKYIAISNPDHRRMPMLTPQDELLTHQLPTTFDHVGRDLR